MLSRKLDLISGLDARPVTEFNTIYLTVYRISGQILDWISDIRSLQGQIPAYQSGGILNLIYGRISDLKRTAISKLNDMY